MASRTCPACQRRYAGLIDPECVICGGRGVLGLGAAALHKQEPPAVARAIEVYLEAAARAAQQHLPIGDERREALAAAVDELRHGGLIADNLQVGR